LRSVIILDHLFSHLIHKPTAYPQPWITPSLFEDTGNTNIVDEWTFGQLQDATVAKAALVKHWDTWITEDDFKAIAAAGCVLVVLVHKPNTNEKKMY
jgi:aryl-phospho-beta-D-glucosidase BglC (GH1 family)